MGVKLPLAYDYFAGGANLTPEDNDLSDLINQLCLEPWHDCSGALVVNTGVPGLNPTFMAKGCLFYVAFTLDTDIAYRNCRIPITYHGDDASFCIHWTKSTDNNQFGNTVRWRFSYNIYNGGDGEDAAGVDQVYLHDDTYQGTEDEERLVQKSPYVPP